MKKVLGIALLGSLLLTGMAFSNLTRDRGVSSDSTLKVGCPLATLLGGANQERICPVTGVKERSALPYHPRRVDDLLVVHSSQQEATPSQKVKAQSVPGAGGQRVPAQGCPMMVTRSSSLLNCPMMGTTKAVSSSPCPMMGGRISASTSCPMVGNKQGGSKGKGESPTLKKDSLEGSKPAVKQKMPSLKQTVLPKGSKDI